MIANIPTFLFWRIRFNTSEQVTPFYAHALEELGGSVAYFTADDETWTIDVTLESSKNLDLNLQSIQKTLDDLWPIYNLTPPKGVIIEGIPEKDWLKDNLLSFPPITIGKFFIYGSHFKGDIPEDKLALEIDAALAFGSGEHASTQGCLMAISQLSESIGFSRCLDMGCGSGILAMAAAKLWQANTLACDMDPISCKTTQENVGHHGLSHLIEVRLSEGYQALKKDEKFDLILANILAGPLSEMAPDLRRHILPKGFVVLAGLLERQASMVIKAHEAQGLTLYKQLNIDGWSTLILTLEH